MVPGGRYFRICVASASADTASFPSPHGRGDNREPRPQMSGEPAETTSAEAHSQLRGLAPVGALREQRRTGSPGPPHPSNPQPHLCPPLHHARGHLPPHAASRSPCRKGSAPHARTLAGVGSRREQCFYRSTPDTKRTHRTVAASRGAEGNVPCRPPHRPPLSAPVHTSNQQQRRARRAEVRSVAGSAAADSPPSNKPEASESEEPRAQAPHSHLFPRAWSSSQLQEHGRPAPFAAAPSYCFTPAERAREPPSTTPANQASLWRAGPNLLASLCGARAVRLRARSLGRPESQGTGTGLKPGREAADLTSQGSCLSLL
nr:uncharacterized protein LOC110555426 [Meriones unguiculatus]